MFREAIITSALSRESREFARQRKMFRQIRRPLREEILARSMKNVGLFYGELSPSCAVAAKSVR